MVILGFRPKAPAVKEPNIKVTVSFNEAENKHDASIRKSEADIKSEKGKKSEKSENVKPHQAAHPKDHQIARQNQQEHTILPQILPHKAHQTPSKNQNKSQSHYKTAPPAPVSSNWKRMKSLKVLTAQDIKNSSNASARKVINDAEWFGVKDVEEFVAGTEDQILRENVSTSSLFPPPPSGISEEKLKQPCKFIALDCEMVGTGLKGFESILARVSVVNFHGNVLLDVYVRPTRKVVDYRTAVSGVTAGHLTPSKEDSSVNIFGQPLLGLPQLQERLVTLLQERIVIGHALHNDFSALLLSSNHPRKLIRDTSRYKPFKALANGRSPSLKMLAAKILGVKIQGSSHDSVDDARIAMLLYRAVKSRWENLIFTRGDRKTTPINKKKRRHRGNNESETDADQRDEESASTIFNPLL